MVTYEASSAAIQINVVAKYVSTTLTLVDPSPGGKVQGDTFTLQGRLTRDDTGAGVPNMAINLYRNVETTPFTWTDTDLNGYYVFDWLWEDVPGTYTYTAVFEQIEVAGLIFLRSIGSVLQRIAGEVTLVPLLLLSVAAYLLFKKR